MAQFSERTMTNGVIDKIETLYGGTGYTNVPTLMIDPPMNGNLLFSDDFENGLSQWSAGNYSEFTAVQANDPMNQGHGKTMLLGNDVFTTTQLKAFKKISIDYDYMVSVPGFRIKEYNCVCLTAFDIATSAGSLRLCSSLTNDGLTSFICDNQWHHASTQLDPDTACVDSSGQSTLNKGFSLYIQNYGYGTYPPYGNITAPPAYFDNIKVSYVAETSTTDPTEPVQATAAVNFNNWGISGVTMINKGRGYATIPSVIFVGRGAAAA